MQNSNVGLCVDSSQVLLFARLLNTDQIRSTCRHQRIKRRRKKKGGGGGWLEKGGGGECDRLLSLTYPRSCVERAIHCCEDCSRRVFCGRTATLQGMKVPVDQNRNSIRVLGQSPRNTRTSDLDMFVWKVELLENKMGCTYARTKVISILSVTLSNPESVLKITRY